MTDATGTIPVACPAADAVSEVFHTIRHIVKELRLFGAEGSDAELIERHQHLITTVAMMIGPVPSRQSMIRSASTERSNSR